MGGGRCLDRRQERKLDREYCLSRVSVPVLAFDMVLFGEDSIGCLGRALHRSVYGTGISLVVKRSRAGRHALLKVIEFQ